MKIGSMRGEHLRACEKACGPNAIFPRTCRQPRKMSLQHDRDVKTLKCRTQRVRGLSSMANITTERIKGDLYQGIKDVLFLGERKKSRLTENCGRGHRIVVVDTRVTNIVLTRNLIWNVPKRTPPQPQLRTTLEIKSSTTQHETNIIARTCRLLVLPHPAHPYQTD